MGADMISDKAMIGELARAGSDPSAITLRATPRRAAPSPARQGTAAASANGCWSCRVAGRWAPTRWASTRRCTRPGIEPDWVVGTSIGAINASLIAGSEPADRLDRLEEFWGRVEHGPLHRLFGPCRSSARMVANMLTVTAGIPAFFRPNPMAFLGPHVPLGPDSRRLLRHGAAAGDAERAGGLRPDQSQAAPG